MEKTYKFLKILIGILLVAVVVAGIWYLSAPSGTEPTAETTEPANLAPDFTVYDAEGNAFKLSDFRGKPVILNFWASWCGPCKAEMPDFEEAFAEHGDNVHFLMVDLADGRNETVATGSAHVAEMGYTFPVYYDTEMAAASAYQINSIPMTCFIDAEGVLLSQEVGMISADVLAENISAMLGNS